MDAETIAAARLPIAAEIDGLIGEIACSNSRWRIADAWLSGRLTGDEAMHLLIECDLIEHSTGMPV